MEYRIRTIRATLNKALQACSSVEAIKSYGVEFEKAYGGSIWGCYSQPGETFASLFNAHLQREREAEEWREDDRFKAEHILSEIEGCGQPGWFNLKAFIERRPELMDRQEVLDALEERRVYLEIPSEEE